MSGELWRGLVQFGKEAVYGTPVAATRRMYFADPALSIERDPRAKPFATGSRDNIRDFKLGPTRVGGTLAMPMSADESLELFLMAIKGGVAGAGAGAAKLFTFTPGESLDSATVEWHDGARAWQAAGCLVNSMRIAGSVAGENTITAEIFGKAMVANPLTAALAQRVPKTIEGWETKFYIDGFGGNPGTTNVPGTLINWDIAVNNNLGRKYFADNTQDPGKVTVGVIGIEATLTAEADLAGSLTEFQNWLAATKRLIRVEFGQNELIGAGPEKKFVSLDLPGAWSAAGFGTDEGTRVIQFRTQYVYDPVNAFGFQARVQTDRAAAWAA